MPQQFNPVLPSPIRISGFVWPQLGFLQLWHFIQIVFKRLGLIRDCRFPQRGVFEFCVSKPSFEDGARREEFSLSYRCSNNLEVLFFTPHSVWISPLAVFIWVKHTASKSDLLLCFPYSSALAYTHFRVWLNFYKGSSTQFHQNQVSPLLGGFK